MTTTTKTRGTRTLLTLLAATLLVPAALQAQARGPGGDGPGLRDMRDRAPAAERILAVREHLQLRDDQLQELEQMRQEAVGRRVAALGEMEELRSRVRAGDLARDELRALMQASREAAREVREQHRERMEGLLDEEQLEAWRELQRDRFVARRGEGRREMGPRRGGRRGPGGR